MNLLTIFAIFVAKFVDPIALFSAFVVMLLSPRDWRFIPLAAVISAIIGETVLTMIQYTRTWGEGILLAIIVGIVHACLSYWVIGKFKKSQEKVET